MSILRVILGDQLTHNISALEDANSETDHLLMCEVWDETKYVPHHKKKIALIFSAMRHFAEELKQKGFRLTYIHLTDPENQGSFTAEILRYLKQHNITEIILTMPSEYRVLKNFRSLEEKIDIPLKIRPDTRFLASLKDFKDWAKDRKELRLEYFYRMLRQKHNILMEDGKPIGGKWNFDQQNRQKPSEDIAIPNPTQFETDIITQDVLTLIEQKFASHFGDLHPFPFAVTRKQALIVLDEFIAQRLENFGAYQDAMLENQPWMFHSHLSFYLNIGLLTPIECIQAAEKAYHSGKAPLNSVEGFIRQILGWREYVRGLYWYKMPDYKELNFLEANRKLPSFFWDGNTKLNCLRQVILETKQNAYAHHIQRLMVVGNFSLLAGLAPKAVNEWYLLVYADAFEWVELPNVSGMILYADGGLLASKPYAAGGSYIHKMSNYCKNCSYKVSVKNGPKACPFNYLYWNFLEQHQSKFEKNPRMSMMYRTLEKMPPEKRSAIKEDSQRFLKELNNDA